jgi:adenine deaminase
VLAVARGNEPADLLLRGGDVFVPGTREWVRTDLAVADVNAFELTDVAAVPA